MHDARDDQDFYRRNGIHEDDFGIKKYYKEFLQGNDTLILNNLKKEISENTYNHIINQYKEYKRKLT